jgi:hypothetical protein
MIWTARVVGEFLGHILAPRIRIRVLRVPRRLISRKNVTRSSA